MMWVCLRLFADAVPTRGHAAKSSIIGRPRPSGVSARCHLPFLTARGGVVVIEVRSWYEPAIIDVQAAVARNRFAAAHKVLIRANKVISQASRAMCMAASHHRIEA